MAKRSAGILLYRLPAGGLEVFLVHPGGPFWAKKDTGAWTIPKGEIGDNEEPLAAARREFAEETGLPLERTGPCAVAGDFKPLQPIRQRSGKVVLAWAVEGDCDATAIRSNMFSLEYPPKSGNFRDFPEVDKAAWYPIGEARRRLHPAQVAFLDQLERILS